MTTRKIRTTLFAFATALFLAILAGCGTTSTSAASSTTPAGSSTASTTTPTSATGAMSSTTGMPMPAAPAGPHKQADIYVGNTKHLAGGPMLGNSVSSSISNVMDRAGIPARRTPSVTGSAPPSTKPASTPWSSKNSWATNRWPPPPSTSTYHSSNQLPRWTDFPVCTQAGAVRLLRPTRDDILPTVLLLRPMHGMLDP